VIQCNPSLKETDARKEINGMLYIVAIGWMFVVVLMSVVEATAPNGSVLGALFTFLLYGVIPLGLVLYLLGTPLRARQRQAQESDIE
jgi:predicted membrane channel-forming protein YqfA (hemolysin III family)